MNEQGRRTSEWRFTPNGTLVDRGGNGITPQSSLEAPSAQDA